MIKEEGEKNRDGRRQVERRKEEKPFITLSRSWEQCRRRRSAKRSGVTKQGASIPWGPWEQSSSGRDQKAGGSNHLQKSANGAGFPAPTPGRSVQGLTAAALGVGWGGVWGGPGTSGTSCLQFSGWSKGQAPHCQPKTPPPGLQASRPQGPKSQHCGGGLRP